MNISEIGSNGELQRVLAAVFQAMGSAAASGTSPNGAPAAGADTGGQDSTTGGTSPPPPTPAQAPSGQFAADTLKRLIDVQSERPTADQLAQGLIQQLDTNGDGAITLDEVQNALGSVGDTNASQIAQGFAKLDTNGDGKIDATELAAGISSMQNAHHGHGHHGHHHGGGDGGLGGTDTQTATSGVTTPLSPPTTPPATPPTDTTTASTTDTTGGADTQSG